MADSRFLVHRTTFHAMMASAFAAGMFVGGLLTIVLLAVGGAL